MNGNGHRQTLGVSIKELYQLLPSGQANIAAKMAGIPKARGYIRRS
jgi:tRNA 2-thiouridine synthesizing protein E